LAPGLGETGEGFDSSIVGQFRLGFETWKLSKSAIARGTAGTYTTVIRGVPELLLLLIVYYGTPTLIQDIGAGMGYEFIIDINPFVAGVATIGFIYGAFATEVFRGAILAVPKGQIEAAYAAGMTRMQMVRRVMLPQVWRFGWYLNPPGDFVIGQVADPGQGLIPIYNDVVVAPNVWVTGTFNLFTELPMVATIDRIRVGGSGWDFHSIFDNVSISGVINPVSVDAVSWGGVKALYR